MAAFRGRSLDGRLVFEREESVGGEVKGGGAMGLGCCASASVSLMFWASGRGEFVDRPCWPVSRGGRWLLISGDAPAMEVSGMLVLRGGGGTESRE